MSDFDDAKRKAIEFGEEQKEVFTKMEKAERWLLWAMACAFGFAGWAAGKFF